MEKDSTFNLRDEIAMRCPDSEINKRYEIPALREHELMVQLGIIAAEIEPLKIPASAKSVLRAWFRYQYADDMLKAREMRHV